MVVVMKKDAGRESIDKVIAEVTTLGFTPHISEGESRTLIGAIGPAPTEELRDHLAALTDVETVVRITKPFKLAAGQEPRSPDVHQRRTRGKRTSHRLHVVSLSIPRRVPVLATLGGAAVDAGVGITPDRLIPAERRR